VVGHQCHIMAMVPPARIQYPLEEAWRDPGLVWTGAGEEKISYLHWGHSI